MRKLGAVEQPDICHVARSGGGPVVLRRLMSLNQTVRSYSLCNRRLSYTRIPQGSLRYRHHTLVALISLERE
jgi:hypothetical protein